MDEDNNELPTCFICPETMADNLVDLRKLPPDVLRQHTAVCHLDLKKDENESPSTYACLGSTDRYAMLCTPDQPYETMAVNDFVKHMEEEHSNQAISSQSRYKAALSDFMAELSIYKSVDETASSDESGTSSSVEDKALDAICDYVLRASKLPSSDHSNLKSFETKKSAPKNEPGGKKSPLKVSTSLSSENEGISNTPPMNKEEKVETPARPSPPTSNDTNGNLLPSTTIEKNTGSSPPTPLTAVDHAISSVISNTNTTTSSPSVRISQKSSLPPPSATKNQSANKAMFIPSAKFNALIKKLNDRYKPKSRTAIECAKCFQSIVFNDARQSLLNHAMSHMIGFAFECVVCGHNSHTYTGWYMHMRQNHPEVKRDVDQGLITYRDFYVDKRMEMEDEMMQILKQCFDT